MTSSIAGWVDVLDRLDADLDAASAAISAGETPRLARFSPPRSLPPIPDELRARLVAISERQRIVQCDLESRLASVATAMNGPRRPPASDSTVAPRSAARFETRA